MGDGFYRSKDQTNSIKVLCKCSKFTEPNILSTELAGFEHGSLAIWGALQQTVFHHQSFSSVDKRKRAIVKSMAETTAWRSYCQFITFITFLFTVNVIRQMAPLFSKVDSNKLWHDVQNEETAISAKFCKDLFNISKVMGRKTKWPRFFGLSGSTVK